LFVRVHQQRGRKGRGASMMRKNALCKHHETYSTKNKQMDMLGRKKGEKIAGEAVAGAGL